MQPTPTHVTGTLCVSIPGDPISVPAKLATQEMEKVVLVTHVYFSYITLHDFILPQIYRVAQNLIPSKK